MQSIITSNSISNDSLRESKAGRTAKGKRLSEEVDARFKKHPDVKFCSASYPLAGYDLKVVGIEKMTDGIYLLKNYMDENYNLTHWGLDILAGVVGAMPKD